MGRAAVPDYLDQNFKDTAPGHRFGLYFQGWEKGFQSISGESKKEVLDHLSGLSQDTQALLNALRQRQSRLAQAQGADVLSLPAKATAPLTTGLGNEHPLENGFAFLNPYGVPYLPGSGVKGVLRRAAEQLALFEADSQGWDIVAVWWLFGFEPTATYLTGPTQNTPRPLRDEAQHWRDSYPGQVDRQRLHAFVERYAAHDERGTAEEWLATLPQQAKQREQVRNRGALCCWDVFPQLERLRVDILNPHHTQYYQNGQTPHDAENPVPVFFLTLPSGSGFEFHIHCQTARLPEGLRTEWAPLVQAALNLAFDWLGFGAKTAVGYGHMAVDQQRIAAQQAEEKARRQAKAAEQQAAEHEAELAKLSPVDRKITELSGQANSPKHRAKLLSNALMQGDFADAAPEAAQKIRTIMQDDKMWRETTQKKNPKKDEEHQATLKVQRFLV